MRIAVFTKNWFGDVIFETPAIRVIKENIPNAHLVAITTPRCVDLLEVNPYVNEVIPFDEKGDERGLLAKLKFMRKLRAHQIDRAYLFHRSSTRARIAKWAGIRERIGYNTKGRDHLLTYAVPEPSGPIHDVQYFLDLLSASGLRVSGDYAYEFYFSKSDDERAESLLKEYGLDRNRLVAVNAGANWAPKRWPADFYRELVHQLIGEYGGQVALTGSCEDEPIARQIMGEENQLPIVSLCGKTSIRELGAFYSKCRLLISNDSGPLHVGAGVGINVVGIFGPTAPRETAPIGRGKNVLIHYAPEGVSLPWIGKHFPAPWMEHISVDDVFQTIRREHVLSIPLEILSHVGARKEGTGNV